MRESQKGYVLLGLQGIRSREICWGRCLIELYNVKEDLSLSFGFFHIQEEKER